MLETDVSVYNVSLLYLANQSILNNALV